MLETQWKNTFHSKKRWNNLQYKAIHNQGYIDLETNIEIAQSLFQQNKFQESIDTCNKVLAANNNSTEAIKLIAKSF